MTESEATWYKDAVIYEVRARSFFDSNGDGIGDFLGLASKLDYLQDLGVTALWLLPFYPSPGRDDGYDISDYTGVHPELGTLADFELLLDEAHRRGLRIITELVLNHTSDQHPWFQRARRAPAGSPERDFYVWSESPDAYRDARIIFKDFETSNWTWDRDAKAYYWHRFYAHQPDLNFRNPRVHDALLEVVDYWLAKGVDGLRLDAVPYLYEEEGTNCENLPATHAFLKNLRAHIDARYSNRLLLAEANQWPEDAAAYFGEGDECHMNFHFPLMPRMFMSLHMEDRFPITDIFAQTPVVDPSCQWALFLRNHDELTLEMVTDEERDYMYRAYAQQAAMRINLGIRRRFAPLVGNSRRKMELLQGLLFSLPGTPVLYYGDEIGMGDNVYLGDRNGVRTPMQWNMDRNAGFSMANPQRLILPVVIDPEYHYESLNVENQQRNSSSFLWWTKRLIALRKRFAAFGRGDIEFLNVANSRVLAFVRAWGRERVLVVANLSRFVQYAELDLARYAGMTPIELFGKTRFPVVQEPPYALTLGPHGFYWFSLEGTGADAPPASGHFGARPRVSSTDAQVLAGDAPFQAAIAAYVESRPWFRGHDRARVCAEVGDVAMLSPEPDPIFIAFVRVDYSEGDSETYAVPVGVAATTTAPLSAILAELVTDGPEGARTVRRVALDALEDPVLARKLLRALLLGVATTQAGAALVTSGLAGPPPSEEDLRPEPRKVGSERFDTTMIFGERIVLQFFRRIEPGVGTEVELGRFLAGRTGGLTPRLEATVELTAGHDDPQTLAVLHGYVRHVDTAWRHTLEELTRYYDRALATAAGDLPAPPLGPPLDLARQGVAPPPQVAEMIGSYLDTAAQLARRVAELHWVLGRGEGPEFAPEPYTAHDRRSKYQALRNLSGTVLRLLRADLPDLAPRARGEAERVLALETEILKRFEPLLRLRTNAVRIRVHGNLHLGHVLFTGKDFVLTGTGGNRAMDAASRARKRSPLRDLAGMVRSFDFAALKQLLDPSRVRENDIDRARPWALHWTSWVSASFLRSYFAAAEGAPFVPHEPGPRATLFDAFVLERALYQLKHELESRPDGLGVAIPLLGISHLLAAGPSGLPH